MEESLYECVERIRTHVTRGEMQEALCLIRTRKDGRNESSFLKAQALFCIAAQEYNAAQKFLCRVRDQNPEDMETYALLTACYEHGMQQWDSYGSVNVVDTDEDQHVSYTDTLNLYANRRVASFQGTPDDAPLVSIYFLAYNHLEEYTKPSIEALLRYTDDIDYELILVDNGSSDDTLAYFEQIPYEKKRIYRITENKGAGYGYIAASRFCRGKFFRGQYIVMLPQDVFVTKNWLTNLLCCMESDEKIGMVAPFSNFVSNLQQVDLGFTDMEDMQKKAAVFNQSDPTKWEERLRLVPTTYVVRSELWDIYQTDPAFVYNFMDDDQCCIYRRLGYRLMACGDTFVYHGGHIGFQNVDKLESDLEKGRTIFRNKYWGIDAWRDMMNLDMELCVALSERCRHVPQLTVLGVDVRCGAPLLSLRNLLYAKGVPSVLAAYTCDAKYYADLQTVVSDRLYCGDSDRILQKCNGQCYDVVMLGEYLDHYENCAAFLDDLLQLVRPGGMLSVKVRRFSDIEDIDRLCSYMECTLVDANGQQRFVYDLLRTRHLSFDVIALSPSFDVQELWECMEAALHRKTIPSTQREKLIHLSYEKFVSVAQEYCFMIRRNPIQGE